MSPLSGRARRLPALVAGVALLSGLAACTGAEDHDPGARSGTPGGTPAPQPPSSLPEGVLQVVSRTPEMALDPNDQVTDPVWTDDWVAWVSAPDDVLHLEDRETGEERWQAKLPVDREHGTSACRAPVPASESTLLVVTGFSCNRVLAYDLGTGELTLQRPVTEPATSGGTQDASLVSLAVVEGRVWFGTFGHLGYFDEAGRQVGVLATEDLGPVLPRHSTVALNRLAALPGSSTLVVGRLHSDEADALDLDFTGIDVSDPDEPGFRWSFSELGRPEDAEVLGLALRRGGPVDVLEEPAAVTLASLEGGEVAVGFPDAETGRLDHSGRIEAGWSSALFEARADHDDVPIALDGTTLYAGTDPKAGSYGWRQVEAWDLASGELLWRTRIAAPEGALVDAEFTVRDVTIGDDGDVYLVADDSSGASELRRLEAASGEVSGTWPLPAEVAEEYEIRVIGDQVWATPSWLRREGSGTVRLEVVDADEALAAVEPATGTVWRTKPLTMRLLEGVEWTGPQITDEPVLWQDARYGRLEDYSKVTLSVSVLPGIDAGPEAYLQATLDAARSSWGAVETGESRQLDGVTVQHVVARDPQERGIGEVQHTWFVKRPQGWVELTVSLPDELPATMHLLESMLLTVGWR